LVGLTFIRWLSSMYLVPFILLIAIEGHGQELVPRIVYSTYYGGIGTDDADVVTVGCHSDTPNLSNTDQNKYTLSGGMDAFIIKINNKGTEIGYLTQLGGSKWDAIQGIISDSVGNIYAIGTTYSPDFKIDAHAFQPSFGGESDAFVVKLSPKGKIVWSTFLGGSNDEDGRGISMDQDGNIHVIGRTASDDFPALANAIQPKSAGRVDAFFATLDPDGTVLQATYLGGSGDDIGFAIDQDNTGRVYLAGTTNSTDFPVCDAIQMYNQGGDDLFVAVLDSDEAKLEFASYWGGEGDDRCYSLDISPSGDLFIMGVTDSPDLPITQDAFQQQLKGSTDAFVSRLDLQDKETIYSTYLGGEKEDSPRNLVVDVHNRAYIVGKTTSSDFPTSSHMKTKFRGRADAFVTMLDSNGSRLVYSTLFGGEGLETFEGVAIGADGSLTVSGLSDSVDFPLVNSLQGTFMGGRFDIVVTRFIVSNYK